MTTTTESARWKRTVEDFSALARDCERTLDRRDGASSTSSTSASSNGSSLVKLTVEARRLLSGLKAKAKAAEDALEAQKSELCVRVKTRSAVTTRLRLRVVIRLDSLASDRQTDRETDVTDDPDCGSKQANDRVRAAKRYFEFTGGANRNHCKEIERKDKG